MVSSLRVPFAGGKKDIYFKKLARLGAGRAGEGQAQIRCLVGFCHTSPSLSVINTDASGWEAKLKLCSNLSLDPTF